MKEKEVHLRVSMDLWKYLGELPDKTDYITKLIDRDRLDRLDHKVIDSKIREHQEAIKDLQGLKKTKSIDQDQIHEILTYHAPAYQKNAELRSERQRLQFLEKSVMPKLKKLGYKGSPQEIDELLLNWPEAD